VRAYHVLLRSRAHQRAGLVVAVPDRRQPSAVVRAWLSKYRDPECGIVE
jgi:hypothetical protein